MRVETGCNPMGDGFGSRPAGAADAKLRDDREVFSPLGDL
jgi:hypothetical protein